MKLVKCKKEDLKEIERLLYEEYLSNSMQYGFWCNIDIIRDNLKDLKIIKECEKLIGFVLMNCNMTPCIMWLKFENRNQGIGRRLVDKFEKQVIKKGNKCMGVCATDESIGFWLKLGYKIHIGKMMTKDLV